MVALLKLSVLLFCLASVSAIEKALLDTFAEVVINAINKDETSGPYLYVLFGYSNVEETDDGGVSFDLAAAQTTCPKDTPDKDNCKGEEDSPMLFHKVTVTKKGNDVYSVTNTGSMHFYKSSSIPVDPVILRVVLFKMVALLKLSVLLLCLASVSAIEQALLDKFAEVVVNAINKDETSGRYLYVLYGYSNVVETEDGGVSFDLVAAQTSCPKTTPEEDKGKCEGGEHSPMLFHKVNVTKKGDNRYSVTNTGSMVPFQSRQGGH
ncbi:hypothetical protein M513_13260 [Trichuris suis]|uniref:Cystatin domain-containing protein n=1 Tax=Trichuris suis TaxID=68888 RepID=A0A085LLM4_9BILA|nr:hypothetical protein M513_13260 [Trichuris suis]